MKQYHYLWLHGYSKDIPGMLDIKGQEGWHVVYFTMGDTLWYALLEKEFPI